ncbi:MAG: hypothetical protein ACFFD4_13095 [Candidatus Odinarchaeota archaeon]
MCEMESDLKKVFEEMAPYLANIWEINELFETKRLFETKISRIDLIKALKDLMHHRDVQNNVTLVTDLKIIVNRLETR